MTGGADLFAAGYANNNAAAAKPAGPPPKPEPVVIRFQAAQRQRLSGNDVMVITGTEVLTGQPRQFGVENEAPQDKNKPATFKPKEYVAAAVKDMKPGDYLRVEPKTVNNYNNVLWADKAEAYVPAEHEEEPNVYVWDSSFKAVVNKQDVYQIDLTKFGKRFECYAQMVPAEKGKDMVADPAIVDAADAIEKAYREFQGKSRDKKKFPVEVTITGQAPALFVTSLNFYQAPIRGTFTKLSEADVNGQKGQAVEVDQDGKAVTLLVPGKMVGKKWVTDPQLLAEAKRLKAGVAIVYRTREAEGKSYLRQLALAPKDTTKKETASPTAKPPTATATKEPAKGK
jgi:hypothetical protein